eukprot:GEMP01099744.1.p1 GENE.GEMP01099744.1~~GEMP01099744.1.p1  ORF type:complete len:100 (+),score=10.53 GEMP01099744.1:409-708(+)
MRPQMPFSERATTKKLLCSLKKNIVFFCCCANEKRYSSHEQKQSFFIIVPLLPFRDSLFVPGPWQNNKKPGIASRAAYSLFVDIGRNIERDSLLLAQFS